MSASSKKKLRKEQNAAAMTEKQQQAQKEAKSLKRYTLTFIVSMVLIAALVIGIVLYNPVNRAIDNSTVAITVGGHELKIPLLNYFYINKLDECYADFNEKYGEYAFLYAGIEGLDFYKPLDEQAYPKAENKTWADYFIDEAVDQAHRMYSLYLDAQENNYKLTEEELKEIETEIDDTEFYALYYYGFSSLDAYLRSVYGGSSNEENFREYLTIHATAQSYYNHYYDELDFGDKDYREHEKDKYENYTFFDVSMYQIMVSSYYKGGTKDENGNTTYSDAEKKAAADAALKDAKALSEGKYKDKEFFDKAIAALEINKDKESVESTRYESLPGGENISDEQLREWLEEERTESDMLMFPTTVKDEDGKETITGYYVVMFHGREDNNMNLVNVRHILLQIKQKTDKDGNKTFDETDKAAVLKKAEEMLENFKNGKDTSAEAFGELAKKESKDGSAKEGGIIADVYPGKTVTEFNDWCFDKDRKVGDTGIVLTDYGYHIMFFESFDEQTYRDYLIDQVLSTEASDKWAEEIIKDTDCVRGNLSRLDTDRTMA